MTQINHIVPPTKLMAWYESLERGRRNEALRAIIVRADVSETYAKQWIQGRGVAKREDHLQALEDVTGISKSELFNFIEQ